MLPPSPPSHDPADNRLVRPGPSAPAERDQPSQARPSQSQSLPSIRQLHPDLPPAPPRSPVMQPGGSAYPHSQAPDYSVASGSTLGPRPSVDESDAEGDMQEPPKKKRRRQALSCTECKRRKIKCDRAQPCGPCNRRGEPQKCQWRIIEPMEKYVTRTEYDELKAKVTELEVLVARLTAGSLPAPPSRMAAHAGSVSSPPIHRVEPIQGTAITPYHAVSSIAPPSVYHSMPSGRPLPNRVEPSPHLHRASRQAPTRSPSSRPSTSQGSSVHTASAVSPVAEPLYHPSSPHASADMPSTPALGSSGSVSSRRASLSVAAITNPSSYHPHSRPPSPPKKYQAQTPPSPGQRLRLEHLRSAPASHTNNHYTLLRSPAVDRQRASLIPA